MSEEPTTPATVPAPQASGGNAQSVRDLPEWAQNLIKDTRAEAADYRTRLRDAKGEVRGELEAEYKTKFDAVEVAHKDLESKFGDSQLFNDKLSVALDVGLGGTKAKAFAERLRGNTIEELKADAESALEIFGEGVRASSATDLTQGQGTDPKKTTADIMGDFITRSFG